MKKSGGTEGERVDPVHSVQDIDESQVSNGEDSKVDLKPKVPKSPLKPKIPVKVKNIESKPRVGKQPLRPIIPRKKED